MNNKELSESAIHYTSQADFPSREPTTSMSRLKQLMALQYLNMDSIRLHLQRFPTWLIPNTLKKDGDCGQSTWPWN